MNSQRTAVRDRRTASTSLSTRVLAWLMNHGYSQADLARILGLSQGFISLVKSRERGFTVDHLSQFADHLKMPLGAFLLATEAPRKATDPETAEMLAATERVIKLADKATEAIRKDIAARKTGWGDEPQDA